MKKWILIAIVGLGLTGCKGGKEADPPTPPLPININNLIVIDYNDTQVFISLAGDVVASGATDLDKIQFFDNATCTGTPLGEEVAINLPKGVNLAMRVKVDLAIFVSTGNSGDCVFLRQFTGSEVVPKAPIFERSSPGSPNRESNSPALFGSVFPITGTLKFFSDALCTVTVGSGAPTLYHSSGIQIQLVSNQTSTIYAIMEDALGVLSPCTYLLDYVHTDGAIADPVFTAITPTSPNNTSTTPLIQGAVAASTEQVSLFADAACSVILASGTPNEFNVGGGIQITVAPNFSTTIYAKAVDSSSNPSSCTYMTTYTHDDIAPTDPSFVLESPTTPSNGSLSPLIKGISSADSLTVKVFSNSLCLSQIGQGSKFNFEGAGVNVGVSANSITQIYAQNLDASGNSSNCSFMVEYIHNTFAPGAPTFSGTIPSSPSNNTLNPLILGIAAPRTEALNFYGDENCTFSIGSGTSSEFQSPGVNISALPNTSNSIYVTATDIEGNVSACYFIASYDHSNTPAPSPSFLFSFPSSPSNSSTNPFFVGTADSSIATIRIYDSSSCTNLLGTGTRGQYSSSGVGVSVAANSTSTIFAKAEDIYGNYSSCTNLVTYVHNTVIPDAPGYTGVVPISPNNSSVTPLILGTATINPSSQLVPTKVEFYDSLICVGKLGEGPPADFTGAGVQISVPSDSTTSIYAKTFDAAGNKSACTFLLNYTHDSLIPAKPVFASASPDSPSYNSQSFIKGSFGPSTDFLLRTSVSFYSENSCTNLLGSGTPAVYESSGIQVNLPTNSITSLYAVTYNEVGTKSICQLQLNFNHHDLAPTGLNLNNNLDGSIRINWTPDPVSVPAPSYTLERSLSSQGPFSLVASGLFASTYSDKLVSDQITYYYRVYGENTTGRSQYSNVQSITVTAPSTMESATLSGQPGSGEVILNWGGFPQNMTYRVHRSTQSGGPFVPISNVLTTLNFDDTTVLNDAPYFYIVTSLNPSGESLQSNMIAVTPRPLPAPPSQLKLRVYNSHPTCLGTAGVQLSWTAPSYYQDFAVSVILPTGLTVVLGSTGLAKYVDCGAQEGRHRYYVNAKWGSQYSDPSATVYYWRTASPSLIANSGDSEVILKWTVPIAGTLFGTNTQFFDLYRATDRAGPYTRILQDFTGSSYTDATAVQDTPYFYYVLSQTTTVVGSLYYLVAPESNIVSAQPRVQPQAPANLIVTNVNSSVQFSWSAPSYYNEFYLYTSPDIGGPYTFMTVVPQAFLYSPPTVAGMNYYRVTAKWGASETAPSNIVAYRDAPILGFSVAPTAIQTDLSWNDVVGVEDYRVSRSLTESGNYSLLSTPLVSSYSDSSALTGVGYWYQVQATFSDGSLGSISSSKLAMRTGSNVPSGISIDVTSATGFTAQWTPIVGASNYNLMVGTSSGGPFTISATSIGSLGIVSGLTPNIQYYVKVRANVGVADYDSAAVTIVTNPEPNAPTGEIGDNDINVLINVAIGAVDYDVYRSTDGVNFIAIATNYGSLNYLDTTALNGTAYFYKVLANYSIGTRLSPSSVGYTPGVYPPAPAALSASNDNAGGQAVLNFTKVPGVTQYNIFQSNSSGGPWVTPIFVTPTNENVIVGGLIAGNVYYFTSQSKAGQLTSVVSNVASLAIGPELAAPTAQMDSGGGVLVAWAAISGASTYNVERSLDAQSFDLIATAEATTSYVDTGPVANLTYYYRYQAFNASGIAMPKSIASSAVSVSVAPQAVLGLALKSTDGSIVDIEWLRVPQAANYELLRSAIAGGPYALLTSVTAPTTVFTDTTTSGGLSYFYVIRAVNSYGVKSANSVEKGISLTGAPINIQVANVAGGLSLTWDSLGSASQYIVLRSELAGGPYGNIVTIATNSHIDASVIPGKTYYYRLEGIYADGSISSRSVEINALRDGFIDLQVPIEMTDVALGSSVSQAISFERSQTSLDPNAYDGVVSYQFEMVAVNYDSVTRQAHLIDEVDQVIHSMSIPANTAVAQRFIAIITPNLGAEVYRLKLDQSSVDLSFKVLSARLIVNQTDATRTKIYFPLFAMDPVASNGDLGSSLLTTSSEAFSLIDQAMPYKLELSQISKLKEYNSWELETLTSSTGAAEGKFVLFNSSADLEVYATSTRFSSATIQLGRAPIDGLTENFSTANENELFDLRVRCEYNCSGESVSVHKAGLWVSLQNLTKAYVVIRNASSQLSNAIPIDVDADRNFIDTSLFSSPTVYFQANVTDQVGSTADVSLVSHALDSGVIGLSEVTGSLLSFDNDGRLTQRTGALILPSGDRFLTRILPLGNDAQLHNSSLIIQVSGP